MSLLPSKEACNRRTLFNRLYAAKSRPSKKVLQLTIRQNIISVNGICRIRAPTSNRFALFSVRRIFKIENVKLRDNFGSLVFMNKIHFWVIYDQLPTDAKSLFPSFFLVLTVIEWFEIGSILQFATYIFFELTFQNSIPTIRTAFRDFIINE